MKKLVLTFVVLFVLFTGKAFAQTNWASSELNFLGAGLRYEYVMAPYFTVGGYFSYSIGSFSDKGQYDNVEFGATARWYPSARIFFAEVSLGFSLFEYYDEYAGGYEYAGRYYYSGDYVSGFGLCISPGFGWTIDVGKRGGFFLSPGIKFPITIGSQFNIALVPYVGLGVAF